MKRTSGVTTEHVLEPMPAEPVEVSGVSVLRTPRLLLRPLHESDRAEYLRVLELSRERVERYVPLNEDGESGDAFFDRQLLLCRRGDETGLAWRRVALLVGGGGEGGGGEGGRIAGCFNINNIARGLSFEADVNWWISSDRTGRGLASEGAKAVLDFALADMPGGLGLHMVHGGIVPDNTANIRVALKAGMHHEPGGQSFLKIGSRWVRHERYVRRAE